MVTTTQMRRASNWIGRAVAFVLFGWMILNQVLLLLGFLLKLLGANPGAAFTDWCYRGLDRVMAPFRGIFTPIELVSSGDLKPVLDTSILFAMVVYGVVLLAIKALIDWLSVRIAALDAEQDYELRSAQAAAAEARRQAELAYVRDAEAQKARERELELAGQLQREQNRARELEVIMAQRAGGSPLPPLPPS